MTVSPSGLHSLISGLHEGMLTLAALSIILIILAKLVRKSSNQTLKTISDKATELAEPTSILAALGGSILLIASAFIGSFYTTNGADALAESPLLMNKVMISIIAEEFWIVFLVIRAKYGKGLWNRNGLSAVYVIIGLLGFLFTTEAGSIGGTLAGKGSIIDPIYDMTGIHPDIFFGIDALIMYALVGVTILLGLIFAYSLLKSKRTGS